MQIKFLTLAFVALAAATPMLEESGKRLCPSGYTPFCCEIDDVGVLDATCVSR